MAAEPNGSTTASVVDTASGPAHVRARATRRGPRAAPIAVNLAPMIDVTFLLLIFFLVTTTFERAEGILASDMPRESAVALPISPVVIRLQQTGPGTDDFAMRLDHFENVPSDFAELVDLLRRIQDEPGFDTETPIVIVADNTVRWDHVVGCWNAALRADCARVMFAEP